MLGGSLASCKDPQRDKESDTVALAPEPVVELVTTAKKERVALLIGISDYDASSGLTKLHGVEDVRLMQSELARHGFMESNTVVLTDEQATRANVLSAMEQISEQVTEGSLVYIHYSGHGQQITDNNGDEPDGLDEAMVLFGARSTLSDDYKGEHHLRDDDFGDHLALIQRALGKDGHLLVVLDMCHSGQASKSGAVARSPGYPAGPAAPKKHQDDAEQHAFTRDEGKGEGLANRVVISASRSDERAYEVFASVEGEDVELGALTYAFSKSLRRYGGVKGITYQDIFQDLQHVISRKSTQTPQLEGNARSSFLGGKNMPLEPFYAVKQVSERKVFLDVGRPFGLSTGASVGFYAPDRPPTRPEIEPLCRGQVTEASSVDAVVELDEDASLDADKLRGSRAYIEKPRYSAYRLRVKLSSGAKSARAFLEERAPFLELTDRADYILSRADKSYTLASITSELGVVFTVADEDLELERLLLANLRKKAQYDFLKNMKSTDPFYSVEVAVYRSRLDAGEGKVACKPENLERIEPGEDGAYHLSPGDVWVLEPKNTAKHTAHLHVMLFQPDNTGRLLFPVEQHRVASLVPAGETTKAQLCFKASTPGSEYVRVISGGSRLPLERLFDKDRLLHFKPPVGAKRGDEENADMFAEAFDALAGDGSMKGDGAPMVRTHMTTTTVILRTDGRRKPQTNTD